MSHYRLVSPKSGGYGPYVDRYYSVRLELRKRYPWTTEVTEATLFTNEQRKAVLQLVHERQQPWMPRDSAAFNTLARNDLLKATTEIYAWSGPVRTAPIFEAVSDLKLLAEEAEP